MPGQPQQPTLQIELKDEQWEGTYSNFVLISHSPSEFIIDFARVMPGAQKARVFSRVVMTPPNAKMLLGTLKENITKFENQFGEIKTHGQESGKRIGFAGEEQATTDAS